MSDAENFTPDPATVEYLRRRLPGFKREAAEAATKANGSLKVPCALCGKHYGAILTTNKQPHCPACTKQLKEGYCALVPLGTMGPAFFFKADGMPEKWIGEVISLPAQALEELKKQYQAQEGEKNGDHPHSPS